MRSRRAIRPRQAPRAPRARCARRPGTQGPRRSTKEGWGHRCVHQIVNHMHAGLRIMASQRPTGACIWSPLLTTIRAAGSAIGRGPIANAVHGGTRCSVYFGFGHRGNVVAARQPARQACQRDSQPATSVPWARSFQRRRSTGCPSTASSRTCATTRSGVSSACKHLPRPARQGGPAALALGDNGRRLRSHRACTRPGAQPHFVQALGPLTCACLGRDL